MRTKDPSSIARSMEALRLLIQEGVITHFAADFTGENLVATVRITARDDLSAARVKRAVKRVLEPSFPSATVMIEQGGSTKQ